MRVSAVPVDPTASLLPVSKPPTSIQFVSEHPTENQCISVDHHNSTGDILIGCDDETVGYQHGAKIFHKVSHQMLTVSDHVNPSVIEHNNEVFVTHHDNKRTVVKVLKLDLQKKRSDLLYSFQMKLNRLCPLSVSDEFIASVDKDTVTIQLYDRQAGKAGQPRALITLLLPQIEVITNLKFLTDKTLLVSGWDGEQKGLLNRYRVSGKNLELVWSSRHVPAFPCGLAVDEKGMIYVSGAETRTIFVLNDEGKKNPMGLQSITL